MQTDIAELKDTVYGTDRRGGLVGDVTLLMAVYRDVKRLALAIIAGVVVNAVGILILLARGG